MKSVDKLLNSFIETSNTLDGFFSKDSGDYNHNSYVFVFKDDWKVLTEAEETEIIYDSELFSVATNPLFDYDIILNKAKKGVYEPRRQILLDYRSSSIHKMLRAGCN